MQVLIFNLLKTSREENGISVSYLSRRQTTIALSVLHAPTSARAMLKSTTSHIVYHSDGYKDDN